MTNEEIRNILHERHPELMVDDYRQLNELYIPKHTPGIITWTKDGDCFIYFPNVEKGE